MSKHQIGFRIENQRKTLGLTQQQLANHVSISQQAIDKIEAGLVEFPRKVNQIAQALRCDVNYLLYGETEKFDVVSNLPILGRVQGGPDGNMVMEEGPIDWTYRPPQLARIQDAFAVFVTGDSMVPKYSDGDLAYINPNLTPRRGHFVLIETTDHKGLIKQFVRWDKDTLIVKQFNPEMDITLPRFEVMRVLTVIGSMDRL